MKIYAKVTKSASTVITKVEVIFEVEIERSEEVAAATYKGFYVPEGALLPAEKDAIIDSQAMQDYDDFIQSVEDLSTQYYNLDIYYKNNSPDNSFYFGMFAKDKDGNIVLEFDFTLRVSTHRAHRSTESRKHKKKQEEIRLQYTGGKETKPLRKSVIVNNKEFRSYMDAYLEVDRIIEDAVEKMRR